MEIDFEVNKKAINDIKEKLWSGAVLQMLDRSIKKSDHPIKKSDTNYT